MQVLRRITRFIDNMNDTLGRFFSVVIVASVVGLCYEVVSRGVFDKPTIWAHEASQYPMGIIFMIGGAYALRHHSHVNVDIVYSHVSPKIRAILDIVNSFLLFLWVGVLVWKGWEYMLPAIARLERSGTPWASPLWPLKILIFLGAVLLLLQGLAHFTRYVVKAVTGKDEELYVETAVTGKEGE